MDKMNNNIIKREICVDASTLYVRSIDGEDSSSRIIEGYAIVFNSPSLPLCREKNLIVDEVITPGAITRELLDNSDIKFTMFHNPERILARSNKGNGTLSYEIDEVGVKFSFEAPTTADGDYALSAIGRRDIAGCSFQFGTFYFDPKYVRQETKMDGDVKHITCYVEKIISVYDMTITDSPAYPSTDVEARSINENTLAALKSQESNKSEQFKQMRQLAKQSII